MAEQPEQEQPATEAATSRWKRARHSVWDHLRDVWHHLREEWRAALFVSACVAAYEAILRLIHPSTPGHLLVLALAGAVGFAGNWLAALVRSRAGRRLDSPALIADGDHARVDAYVSLAVIASAVAIAAGAPILDPLIGLGMTVVILRITRESWRTVRGRWPAFRPVKLPETRAMADTTSGASVREYRGS